MTKMHLLRCALGTTPEVAPIRAGSVTSDRLAFELIEHDPLPPAFRLMVRELAFDLTEMPVVTLAQAKERGIALTGLPIPVSRRFHHDSLLCLERSDIQHPTDLVGRKIGVRSFPQTTGVWVRGILQHEYGVSPDKMGWIIQEGAHVLDYREPDYVSYATCDAPLIDLLKSGDVDAITGYKGSRVGLRSVIPEAQNASEDWFHRTHIFPVNHVLAVKSDIVEKNPWILQEITKVFVNALEVARADASLGASLPSAFKQQSLHSYNFREHEPSIQALLDYAFEQQLFRQQWRASDLFTEFLAAEAVN